MNIEVNIDVVEKRERKSKATSKKINILDQLTADDAFAVLRILAEENEATARRIERVAREYLSKVDFEDIASEVYLELDSIDVEEVWKRSGRTRHGYVDPTDMAWEMFEEALEPFLEEMRKYQRLSMHAEAKSCCMGILKGIYRFEKESYSEYKDWATDAPRNYFETVLDEWKRRCKDPGDKREMREFIKKNFPDFRQRLHSFP